MTTRRSFIGSIIASLAAPTAFLSPARANVYQPVFYSGSPPAGTLIATLTLPADWMTASDGKIGEAAMWDYRKRK